MTKVRKALKRRRRKSKDTVDGKEKAPQLAIVTAPDPEEAYVPSSKSGSVSGDAFQLYLREIGQVKLLTPEEVVSLGRRIKRGDKSAREHLIKANLRLVVKIAQDYEGLGLPLLDLINEGNIGLMKGVERFDVSKGNKLSTYVAWWIKQKIKLALANQSKTIRLPVHVVDGVAKIRRTELKLREELDREPSDEEVAGDLGIDSKRVRRYRVAAMAPVSLHAPTTDDVGSYEEVIPDEGALSPLQAMERRSLLQLLPRVLAELPKQEREIIMMRFGFGGDKKVPLEEVGEKLGVSKQRVSQIQIDALKKLHIMFELMDATGSARGWKAIFLRKVVLVRRAARLKRAA